MKPRVERKLFPDGESYVRILNLSSLKGKHILVEKRLYPDPEKNLFELLLILSRLQPTAKSVNLFIPYLPYARQDQENKPGEAVSADVLCKLLKSLGVRKLITYDCHFLPKAGQFIRAGLSIQNLSAGKLLLAHARKYFGGEKFIAISPDQGTAYLAHAALHKTRRNEHKIQKMEGGLQVRGKNVCILDDIISTGGTILHAIKHLRKLGARKIIVGATHGVFAFPSTAGKIRRASGELFVTDSIPQNTKGIKVLKLPTP